MNESDERSERLIEAHRALPDYLAGLLGLAAAPGVADRARARRRWLAFRLERVTFAVPHDTCLAIWPGRAVDLVAVRDPPVGSLGRFEIAGRSYLGIDPAPVFFDSVPVPAARPRSVYVLLDRYGVALGGDRALGILPFTPQDLEERSATTRRPWLRGVSRQLGTALIDIEGLMRVLGRAPRGGQPWSR